MPIQLLTVRRVDSCPTVDPHVLTFHVWGTTIETQQSVTYQTISQWRAALCQRALETQQPVRVTWADSRWGQKLVDVELA